MRKTNKIERPVLFVNRGTPQNSAVTHVNKSEELFELLTDIENRMLELKHDLQVICERLDLRTKEEDE